MDKASCAYDLCCQLVVSDRLCIEYKPCFHANLCCCRWFNDDIRRFVWRSVNACTIKDIKS
jgi:hypothetical protein